MSNPRHLLRFLAVNAAIGVGVGWACLVALLATNAGGLATLLGAAADPIVPLLMLGVVFGVTFGAAVMGTAVLLLPCPSDERRR